MSQRNASKDGAATPGALWGRQLKRARLAAGFTQETLAAALGFVRSTVAGFETGTCVPSRKVAEQCDQLLQISKGVPRVVLVNVRMPRAWESVTNTTLATCTVGRPGVVLVDWYDASAALGVLGPDAIHETPSGAEMYASSITNAVRLRGEWAFPG